MTTYLEIAEWYDRGVAQGATYMIVWVDTYDYEDYPSYAKTYEEARRSVDNPGSMQRVMEVYDLRRDKTVQIATQRNWRLEP